ncbi:ty3-gypsy retrotransposon protein [Tanacetum coccineum]
MRTVGLHFDDVVFYPMNDGSQAGPQGHKGDDNANTGPNVNEGGSKPTMSADVNKENSYASLVRPNVATKVHFRTLVNEEKVDNFDCVLPKIAAAKVMRRYENSIVGFFVGKDPSFPVVQQYVSNTWRKFGFEKITRMTERRGYYAVQPEEEGDGYIREVVRVEYEWKPPHCVDCQSFGHETNLCPKRVREELPKNSARDTKATAMEENDDGFIKVKSRKKKKGADSRSFGGLRLNKPNSKVIWQKKKGTKGGSNSASPSVPTNDNGNGNGGSKQDLNMSNPFDVLNMEGDDMGDSGKQSKGSEQVNSDFNVNNKKDHEPSSSKSACNDVHKDKNVSSYPELKKWDCINESDTDDDDVIPSYGSFLGGGNQPEDEDFDFYDGYEEQVVDLHGALKEFHDFKLSMSGLFVCCTYVQIARNPSFKYHWLCKDVSLTHLCFADDLLLFCHGDSKSASVLKKALDEFGDMPFSVGSLPVRYLGVPLISKRLYAKDCQPLIDKVKKRILGWKNKVLSFAGRLQLVQSVLSSMQVFWASMFILPKSISADVERLLRDFVWNYGELKRGKAKVNWNVVCKPKVEGGLVLSMDYKVADVIKNGMWECPSVLACKFDGLSAIQTPCLIEGKRDKVIWQNNMGRHKDFSVSEVWNDIRSKNELVLWSKLVWFSQCIPRHAFMLWLAIHGRLRTHDLMKLKDLVMLDHAPNSWSDILAFLLSRPINNSIWSILQRLLLGAAVYTVWQERNFKTFQNRNRFVEEVCNVIKDVVRLRVLSLRINPFVQVYEAADIWNFHVIRDIGSKRVKFTDR